MKQLVFAAGLMLLVVATKAQSSAEDSVKNVVATMFRGMYEADTLLLRTVFAETAMLQTIGRGREGAMVQNVPIAAFISSIGRLEKGAADERIRFEQVLVDGDLASVWTPYEFYLRNAFSHCGVNSFQLVRTAGGWKIQYIIDTRRKGNCK